MRALNAVLAVIATIVVIFLVARLPPPSPEMSEAEIAQREAEVRAELASRVDSYKNALLRGDAEAFMSIYTSDARVYWPGMNFARDELQAFPLEFFQTVTWRGYDAKLLDLFAHGDTAYAISEVSETFQMEGQEPMSGISSCFTRFEKVDGEWKVDRDVCGPRDVPPEG